MRGVALTQRKGGSGKTVLSHALALGASWHNVPAYLMHTDNSTCVSLVFHLSTVGLKGSPKGPVRPFTRFPA